MATLRSKETEQKYRQYRAARVGQDNCALCEREPLKLFKYWKIITNEFPYDRIAQRHEMIVPLRHVKGDDLNAEEKEELQEIKRTYITENYIFILEAVPSAMTIPNHFHNHLITIKEFDDK